MIFLSRYLSDKGDVRILFTLDCRVFRLHRIRFPSDIERKRFVLYFPSGCSDSLTDS